MSSELVHIATMTSKRWRFALFALWAAVVFSFARRSGIMAETFTGPVGLFFTSLSAPLPAPHALPFFALIGLGALFYFGVAWRVWIPTLITFSFLLAFVLPGQLSWDTLGLLFFFAGFKFEGRKGGLPSFVLHTLALFTTAPVALGVFVWTLYRVLVSFFGHRNPMAIVLNLVLCALALSQSNELSSMPVEYSGDFFSRLGQVGSLLAQTVVPAPWAWSFLGFPVLAVAIYPLSRKGFYALCAGLFIWLFVGSAQGPARLVCGLWLAWLCMSMENVVTLKLSSTYARRGLGITLGLGFLAFLKSFTALYLP